jgi:hypothetical protein
MTVNCAASSSVPTGWVRTIRVRDWDGVGVLSVVAASASCPRDWESNVRFDTCYAPDGGAEYDVEGGFYRFEDREALLRYKHLPMSSLGRQRVLNSKCPAGADWVAYY